MNKEQMQREQMQRARQNNRTNAVRINEFVKQLPKNQRAAMRRKFSIGEIRFINTDSGTTLARYTITAGGWTARPKVTKPTAYGVQ